MKLTAPIHVLKGKAKKLKRSESITMTEALDRIARSEGFNSWSLLQSKMGSFVPKTKEDVLDYLYPGDLVLISARPYWGKTTFTLQLLLHAAKGGRSCIFFSFEYTRDTLIKKLKDIDPGFDENKSSLAFDLSDEISSDYIIRKTGPEIGEGTIIAIDYLQLLDHDRTKPPLQHQVEDLKAFAREKRCIVAFISQIDRNFNQNGRKRLAIDDIRLPNPLDLSLFNKSIFVQNGTLYI